MPRVPTAAASRDKSCIKRLDCFSRCIKRLDCFSREGFPPSPYVFEYHPKVFLDFLRSIVGEEATVGKEATIINLYPMKEQKQRPTRSTEYGTWKHFNKKEIIIDLGEQRVLRGFKYEYKYVPAKGHPAYRDIARIKLGLREYTLHPTGENKYTLCVIREMKEKNKEKNTSTNPPNRPAGCNQGVVVHLESAGVVMDKIIFPEHLLADAQLDINEEIFPVDVLEDDQLVIAGVVIDKSFTFDDHECAEIFPKDQIFPEDDINAEIFPKDQIFPADVLEDDQSDIYDNLGNISTDERYDFPVDVLVDDQHNLDDTLKILSTDEWSPNILH